MSNRFALRAATHHDHMVLDAALSHVDIGSVDGYRDFLLWHAGIVPALERHLEHNGIGRILPDWAKRTRRAALSSDLDALNETPFPLSRTLGTSHAEDPGHTPAALWGIAYVLEGSRLGASVLIDRIPRHLRGSAATYLAHGHDDRLWFTFSRALDETALTDDDLNEAGTAARSVFTLFAASIPQSAPPALCSAG